MSVTRIATRYAKSLLELAAEQGNLESIHGDISHFKEVLNNREFALMLKSPIIKSDKKGQIFRAIFGGKVEKLTGAFFDIIIKKGREIHLPAIAEAFIEQYNALKKVSSVKLTTAGPISDSMLASIKTKLIDGGLDAQNIEVESAVNPDLIGGFVLEFGDQLYDASVAHKLELLRKEFSK